jgi:hypothetical protein
MESSHCKSCKAPLLWTLTQAGNAIPLNKDPDIQGDYFLVNGTACWIFKAEDIALTWSGPRYALHVCPEHAEEAKAKKGGKGKP